MAGTWASAGTHSLVGLQLVVCGEGADASEGAEAVYAELLYGDLHGLAFLDLLLTLFARTNNLIYASEGILSIIDNFLLFFKEIYNKLVHPLCF